MKNVGLYIVLLFFAYPSYAQQNHVPNGGFEDHTGCPNSLSQFSLSTGWYTPTLGTSDYYNSCAQVGFTNYNMRTPSNSYGYQVPVDGVAYAAIIDYAQGTRGSGWVVDYREYLARDIIPLVKEQYYRVSYFVSAVDKTHYVTNDFGAFFFKGNRSVVQNDSLLSVIPQVSFAHYGIIKDTVNWVQLTGVFQADSAYDHIIIGGFLTDSMQMHDSFSTVWSGSAYYYLDAVSVVPVDTFVLHAKDTTVCAGDTLQFKYYAQKDYVAGNVFTMQLSDSSGSFANPVVIGKAVSDTSGIITCIIPPASKSSTAYKIRLVASSQGDTTQTIGLIIGNVNDLVSYTNSPICSSDTLLLMSYVSSPNAVYAWTGPGGFMSSSREAVIKNPVASKAGKYVVTANVYGCTATDTNIVVVHDGVKADNVLTSSNSPICTGDTLQLHATADGASFDFSWTGPISFNSNEQNILIQGTDTAMSGMYVVAVSNVDCIVYDTVQVLVKPSPDTPVLSSNGPVGKGETLVLEVENPSGSASFLWTGPNGFSSVLAKTYITSTTPANSGTYILTTDINGCARSDSISIEVFGTSLNDFAVYPNPNNGVFTIKGLVSTDENIIIEIVSAMGMRVYRQVITPVNKTINAKITLKDGLAAGVYFLRILFNKYETVVPVTIAR